MQGYSFHFSYLAYSQSAVTTVLRNCHALPDYIFRMTDRILRNSVIRFKGVICSDENISIEQNRSLNKHLNKMRRKSGTLKATKNRLVTLHKDARQNTVHMTITNDMERKEPVMAVVRETFNNNPRKTVVSNCWTTDAPLTVLERSIAAPPCTVTCCERIGTVYISLRDEKSTQASCSL